MDCQFNVSQAESVLAAMQADLAKGTGARDLLLESLADDECTLSQTLDNINNWELEKVLLGEASEYARVMTIGYMEQVVTAALQAVFTDEEFLGFKVNMRKLGDIPAADWRITDKSGEYEIENDPEDADGGGVSDVVSLALRAALLEQFKAQGPVFFDESGKHVSAEYTKNLAYFIKTYAERTGRQVLNVTHNRELASVADKSYLVTKTDGISEAVEQ